MAEELTQSQQEKAKDLILELADLFPDNIKDMSQLDAADFKDNAENIWCLVEQARDLRGSIFG